VKIEQNIISRHWTVLHQGKKFYVNFTESDGQTLLLCNRDNWEVLEESEDCIEELDCRDKENIGLLEELLAFCIDNWDNEFMHELLDDIWGQRGQLNGPKESQDTNEGGQE